MSLKANLNQLLKEMSPQTLTLDALASYCKQAKYKTSTAERRLRPSESPNIQEVWNEGHKAIIGYRWKQSETVSTFLKMYPSKPKEVQPVKEAQLTLKI